MSKKYKVWIFWALMLIGALLVVSQSSYSDGDDAFFYQYTNSMGFGEYLSWRPGWEECRERRLCILHSG
mgnify:CR=1 FL=1